jgi:Arm DNA-binding domain
MGPTGPTTYRSADFRRDPAKSTKPAGGRLWRFRYKRSGVEKLLTLGAYPEVSLKRAREKRDDARRQLSDGVDPTAKRRAEQDSTTNTFKAVADEWLLTKKHALMPAT